MERQALTVQFPPALIARVRQMATEYRRSINDTLLVLLQLGIDGLPGPGSVDIVKYFDALRKIYPQEDIDDLE